MYNDQFVLQKITLIYQINYALGQVSNSGAIFTAGNLVTVL